MSGNSEIQQNAQKDAFKFRSSFSIGNHLNPLPKTEKRRKWSRQAMEQYPNKYPLIIEKA